MKNLKQPINIATVKKIELKDIKTIESNRQVQDSHINKMASLIKQNGFADVLKVAEKNKKYYVVEGQHRLEALKKLGVKAVNCAIVDWIEDDFEKTQDFIISLNANNKAWNLYDYTKSWANNKKASKNYKHLLKKMDAHEKSLSVGVVATIYDGILRGHIPLKKGLLTFIDKNFSDLMVKEFYNLVKRYGKKKFPSQVLRQAAAAILTQKDKEGVLYTFIELTVSLITASDNPLPDGDEIFNHWFNESVIGTYESRKNRK